MKSVRTSLPGALLALAVLASGAAQAKPIYITVPRSYSTTEAPVVEVAFASKGAVELRVLRPLDLGAFIQSQSDLRRAYEPPPVQYNPGRALSRGVNAVTSPGEFLRSSLSLEYRKALLPELWSKPAEPGRPVSKLAEGPSKLVGVPPGFQVVRSEWLNLDLGGGERAFDVPGFTHQSSGGFQERQVTLAPLPAGAYVVQLVQQRIEGQVMLVVTDLTVAVKQTDGMALVRVAGLDQKPRVNARVTAYLPSGRGTVTGTTDEKGEAVLKVEEPKLLITAASDGDTAIADTDFYSTLAVAPDVFLYTDRPIYHPGDEVRFRGIVRRPDSFVSRLFSPKQRELAVKLVSDEGGRDVSTRATVDEFGCFSGSFNAPAGLGTGVLRVVADLDAQPHQSEARVQDYVKPTFYVELLSELETVTPGQPLTAKVRARRYAGGAPEETAYEVFLYRSALDTPAWVDDAGKGGQGSAVTYGSASTTEGKLSVPVRLYSSVANRKDAGEDPWATAATFDAEGEARVEVPVPALKPGEERLPFRYTLTVRARDKEGTFANATSTFFLAQTDVQGVVRFGSKVVKANAAAALAIKATTLSGRAFGETDGEVAFVLRKPNGDESELSKQSFKTGADGVWRAPAPSTRVGVVLARVTLKDKQGRPWTGESSLLVVGEGSEPVMRVPALTLESLDGVLEPGTTAQVVALFPEGWGPGGHSGGPVWVTLTGASLFSTRLVQVSGTTLIHAFDVEKRFGSAVYASIAYPTPSGRWEERTVPFRIVPRERTLAVNVQPLRKEAAPLGEQAIDLTVTDSEGHGVAAEVSVGVVDKAVYAVQAEFRPSALDFFYPVGRNNVASFYSAEFQGYGYGEQLARALLQLPGHAFASLKPPTRASKDQDRDTAYWNAAVVTDAEGRATVRFKLPSNQTLWTVTAVAADASGRFGEGTSEFASRGALNLVASLPQFLREGDEAVGSVRLSRGVSSKSDKTEKTLAVTLAASGALAGQQEKRDVTLAAGGEQVVPVALKAMKSGLGELAFAVAGLPEAMADKKRLAVRPAAISEEVRVSAWGGGELAVPLSGTQQVERMELVLQPSIVDAALANVRELLSYPYGCLEQLTSTTVPNIALYQTLKKVDALDKLDPDSQALLSEARSRAVRGIQQILGDSVQGGGFVLWSGESEPSVPLTLIALDGLAYAVDAGLLEKDEPRLAESVAWLEKQDNLPDEVEATRTYVLARHQGARAAPRVRALLANAQPGKLYPVALAVLAAERAGVLREEPLRERVASLVSQSRDGFIQLASYQPPQGDDFFWRYPLRRVGLTAILGHAASFGDLDVAKARRRLLEVLTEANLSTFDRSTALLHSLWLVERDAKALRALPPPSVSGVDKVAFVPRGAGLAAVLPAGTRSLKVGTFDGVATLRASVLTPLSEVKPVEQGMSVSRAYYVLRGHGKQLLGAGDSVAQGEEVYVELTLNALGRREGRSAYYVLEDAVPAGFVPLLEDKAYQGAPYSLALRHEAMKRRSLSPEKATFFFEEPAWWSDAPRTVGYVMRAQFEGRFSAPPATLGDMYAADIRGRSEAATLVVRASKNRGDVTP